MSKTVRLHKKDVVDSLENIKKSRGMEKLEDAINYLVWLLKDDTEKKEMLHKLERSKELKVDLEKKLKTYDKDFDEKLEDAVRSYEMELARFDIEIKSIGLKLKKPSIVTPLREYEEDEEWVDVEKADLQNALDRARIAKLNFEKQNDGFIENAKKQSADKKEDMEKQLERVVEDIKRCEDILNNMT